MEEGQMLHTSPYVAQIEKFADSLTQLANTFLKMENKKKSFTNDEIDAMFAQVKEHVCTKCEKRDWCWGENYVHTCQMGYEILSAVDNYGDEMNVETKRKLKQCCIRAPRFLREMLEAFQAARQNMMWTNRMALSREGCAIQMDTFAEMIRQTAKEMEDSIFHDEWLEKRIIEALKKKGVRVLKTNFFMNSEGKYEIHVTARAMYEQCFTVREIVKEISIAARRKLTPAKEQAQIMGREYITVVCMEGPEYYTLQGVAKVGKGSCEISGDNFMMLDLPGGKKGVALSDGMGSGERACRESTLVIELLEELLEAGFPEKMAIQMINTTLVMGREEIHYSTIDMCVFDLYSGICEFLKAGASSTFIKKKDSIEHLRSTSLPIGVVHKLDVDHAKRQLEDGDFVIMVTDGILDALPVGEQDVLLETIIKGTAIINPKEMAQHILKQVLNWTGKPPEDDMTVLVIGIWKY